MSQRTVLLALSIGVMLFLAACGSPGAPPSGGPTVPTGAVQNVCSTANASLNPAPSKDLAFVVQDAKGNAITNRAITVGFYQNDGTYVGIFWGSTDAKGVFTIDTTQYSWLPSAPLSAFIAVNGDANTPGLATACGNIDGAGTFTLSTGDAALADVTLDLHSGGTATTTPYVFPALMFHGKAREVTSFYAGGTDHVMMLPGTYDLGLFTTWNNAAYILYRPTSISGDTTVSLDVGTEPTTLLHASVSGATAGQAMTQQRFVLFRADANLDMHWGVSSGLPDTYVTPGTYSVEASGSLADSQSLEWQYTFLDPQFDVNGGGIDLTQAGSTVTQSFGGALSASLTTDASSYAAGARVTLTPKVSDPAGDALNSVTKQTSPNWTDVGPTLTVKDPNGTVVYANTLTNSYASIFTLGSSAVAGTYHASLTWDVGPYRSTPLTASTTFQVQ